MKIICLIFLLIFNLDLIAQTDNSIQGLKLTAITKSISKSKVEWEDGKKPIWLFVRRKYVKFKVFGINEKHVDSLKFYFKQNGETISWKNRYRALIRTKSTPNFDLENNYYGYKKRKEFYVLKISIRHLLNNRSFKSIDVLALSKGQCEFYIECLNCDGDRKSNIVSLNVTN